jgi:hypothetical protein
MSYDKVWIRNTLVPSQSLRIISRPASTSNEWYCGSPGNLFAFRKMPSTYIKTNSEWPEHLSSRILLSCDMSTGSRIIMKLQSLPIRSQIRAK